MKIRITITLVLFLLLIIYTDRSAFTGCPKVCPSDMFCRCSPPSHQQPVAPSPTYWMQYNYPDYGKCTLQSCSVLHSVCILGHTLRTDIFGSPEWCSLHVWSRLFQSLSQTQNKCLCGGCFGCLEFGKDFVIICHKKCARLCVSWKIWEEAGTLTCHVSFVTSFIIEKQ